MDRTYVKVIGIKFDALEGLQVVFDRNAKDFEEAGEQAQQSSDNNTIFIGIPCSFSLG